MAARASDVDDTLDAPEAQSLARCDGTLPGGRRHGDEARNTMPEAWGAELFWVGGGGEAGGGEAERNRGQAGTAARLAGGHVRGGMRTAVSLGCGLARELQGRRVLVTAAGNAAEGIPRGNIRGGRDPASPGGSRKRMQHYLAHVTWTRRPAARVTARQWHVWRGGATILEELGIGFRLSTMQPNRESKCQDGNRTCD